MALSIAHNFEAARELLADLQGVPELAPYVLPEVYMQDDQDTAIASIAALFSYVPKPHGTPIHALPQSLATVSLSDRSGYADMKLMAEALILNLPIKI